MQHRLVYFEGSTGVGNGDPLRDSSTVVAQPCPPPVSHISRSCSMILFDSWMISFLQGYIDMIIYVIMFPTVTTKNLKNKKRSLDHNNNER